MRLNLQSWSYHKPFYHYEGLCIIFYILQQAKSIYLHKFFVVSAISYLMSSSEKRVKVMIVEILRLYFVILLSYQVKIIEVQFFSVVSGMRRGTGNLTELNRRITDLKMAGSTNTTAEIRRDSNSTVSTYYGSMKSADLYSSRRSSQVSQVRLLYTRHRLR